MTTTVQCISCHLEVLRSTATDWGDNEFTCPSCDGEAAEEAIVLSQSSRVAAREFGKDIKPYPRYVPTRKVRPTHVFECAGCGFTHADRRAGSNYWHEECLEMHKREFHSPPDRLVELSHLRLSKPALVPPSIT